MNQTELGLTPSKEHNASSYPKLKRINDPTLHANKFPCTIDEENYPKPGWYMSYEFEYLMKYTEAEKVSNDSKGANPILHKLEDEVNTYE